MKYTATSDDPEAQEITLKGAKVYGFKNIQNLIRKLKSKTCKYQYVEIMACPGGCLGGGAQVKIEGEKMRKVGVKLGENMHQETDNKKAEYWFENALVANLVDTIWAGKSSLIGKEDLLYKIKPVEESDNPLTFKW